MKRIIIIKDKKGNTELKSEGFEPFELLGILRYMEKKVFIDILKGELKDKNVKSK